MGRLQEFLNDVRCALRGRPLLTRLQTELLDRYTDDVVLEDASAAHADEIGLAQASFSWSKERETDGATTPSRQTFRLRVEDPLVFKQGCINLIVGPTGCGKSSLLLALLGEMHYVPSGPGAWVNLPREGGLAYWCAGLHLLAPTSFIDTLWTVRRNLGFR
jgi:ABC-type multidrug transport system fused ATPase/permease subunit